MNDKTKSVSVSKSSETSDAAKQNVPAVQQLRSEIDRLFDDFGLFDWSFPFTRSRRSRMLRREDNWNYVPAVDIAETEKAFKLTAELPGMDAGDIDIKLSNGSIIVRGEKEASSETKDENYFFSERQYGSFRRTFTLPEGIDRDKIEADFAKGVLTVTLPKLPEAIKSEKNIKVKAG
ncbi:Hsp20/alpha crystallin family protein [Martelella sp. AMO21009]